MTTATPDVIAVREAGGTWADDLRAIKVVWQRELIRFGQSRVRILTSLAQPMIYLFVLGGGLSRVVPAADAADVDFRTFMFPGVLAMTILFTSIFSAVSIVWDREFGFLREMLVAPVRRGAILFGKCLGGATVATLQGSLMLVVAGFVHIPYSPALLVVLLAEMALTAFVLTAFGMLVASRIAQVESFQFVMQLFVMPMFFLSGAVFPLHGLPRWLTVLTKIDPLSYAVDPMRRAIFDRIDAPPVLVRALNPGITWNGWRLPTLVELAAAAGLGAIALAIAIWRFARTE